jgi:hypothetical protein
MGFGGFCVMGLGALALASACVDARPPAGEPGVGGGQCQTCGAYLDGTAGPLCAGEDTKYTGLISCVCSGPCADACANDLYCDPAGSAESGCDACVASSSGCSAEYGICTDAVPVCVTCAQYLTSPTGALCMDSQSIYSDFVDCVCTGPCAVDCAHDTFCDAQGTADDACDACIQDNAGCYPQYTSCANDF